MRDAPKRSTQSSIPLKVSIPAIAALLIGGGAILWSTRSVAPLANTDEAGKRPSRVTRAEEDFRITEPVPTGPRKFIPRPESRPNVHSMNRVEENGIQLVLIRLVPGGDELVLDAATGKLLETRPSGSNRGEAKNVDPGIGRPGMPQLVAPMGAKAT